MAKFANPLKKDRTITSLLGHSIFFPGRTDKGMTFVHVPPMLVPECISAGLAPEDEIEEKDEPTKPRKPDDPSELRKQMFEAFDMLVGAGDRESFTAAGTPKNKAVDSMLGWDCDNATLKDQWAAYRLAKAEENGPAGESAQKA